MSTVYRYFDVDDLLIYVGVTDRGVKRLHEHADSKPWWHLAVRCTMEHFPDRDAALAHEKELIETLRPPFNEQHNPLRHLDPLSRRALNEALRYVSEQRKQLAKAVDAGAPSGVTEEWLWLLDRTHDHGRKRLSRGEFLRTAQFMRVCETPRVA